MSPAWSRPPYGSVHGFGQACASRCASRTPGIGSPRSSCFRRRSCCSWRAAASADAPGSGDVDEIIVGSALPACSARAGCMVGNLRARARRPLADTSCSRLPASPLAICHRHENHARTCRRSAAWPWRAGRRATRLHCFRDRAKRIIRRASDGCQLPQRERDRGASCWSWVLPVRVCVRSERGRRAR